MKKRLIFLFLLLFGLVGCTPPSEATMFVHYEYFGEAIPVNEFDYDLLSIVINNPDGSTEVVPLAESMLSAQDILALQEAGTHEIQITYMNFTDFVTIVLLPVQNEQVEAERIELAGKTLLKPNEETQITATVFPAECSQDVTWSINNSLASISSTGMVKALGVGEVVIRATSIQTPSVYEELTITIQTQTIPVLEPYYQNAEGLSGTALKTALHQIIRGHQSYSYDFAKTALKETDEDPNNTNNVILFYTGRSQAKSAFGSSGNDWNREHVWAKSHGDFGETKPMGTDLHHLRPTDASVNSKRSNLDFDDGGTKVNDTYGAGSTFCYVDGDSFEPRDEVKGDVARIIFYMAVRYEGGISGEKDLEINDRVNNGTNPYMGKASTLLAWNEQDPVDDFERNRNEVIFDYQNNRNPFIDHPEFADMIWGTVFPISYEKASNNALNIDLYMPNNKKSDYIFV
ncbi:MAG: endonuclease [Bacilli bacterium]|jgi:endonuclease I|nr:endonuclease [Bacilli bacterium]